MSVTCEQISFEPLPAAATAEHYALHRAALEYSLIEPIVIQGGEDIKSKAGWQEGFAPYHHQVQNLITFCRRLPVTLLADDVGLGKTISAGLILGELMTRKRVSRALVLCPAILGPQWVEELKGKFGIEAERAVGAALKTAMSRSSPAVVVTTYESARRHLDHVRPGHFDMVILDEAHKLRNLHGRNGDGPIMAQKVKKALEQRLFKYVLMLTATPIQNRVWDLYSLIDLLTIAKGHSNPLGDPETFRHRFLDDAAGRRLNPHGADEFRSILRQYIQRTRRVDANLKFPDRKVRMWRVTLSAGEVQLFKIVAEHIAGLNKLAQTSLAQAMMSSPQALISQMRNMAANGTFPGYAAQEAASAAATVKITGKLSGLLEIMRQLKAERPTHWRMVVFTIRKETQEAIGEALTQAGVAVGFIRGGQPRLNQSSIERFRSEPPGVNVMVSTDAGAEGVNLQSANVLINYDLPWNPMIVEQRIGRIQRLASKFENVVVVNLVGAGTVEEHVVGRLSEKLQAVSETIGDIEAILESTNMEGEGEENDSFESMIRDLVVKSLIGQNVEAATAAARASIDQAKLVMESQRVEIDGTLGRLDGLQSAGPMLPKITPVVPSIPPEQFVIQALTAEGARVNPRADGTFEVLARNRAPEIITFKEEILEGFEGAVFMGNAPKLYLPGKPYFERLVQRWLQRSAHHVSDLSSSTQDMAIPVAETWCQWFEGAVFQSVKAEASTRFFRGQLVCKAKAATGVDSLEKLIEVTLAPAGHQSLTAINSANQVVVEGPLSVGKLSSGVDSVATTEIASDRDINRFWQFYEQRRQEERVKADGDSRRLAKVDADFGPKLFAEGAALHGVVYELADLDVEYTLDGNAKYVSKIQAIPATQQVIREPERKMCVLTKRRLPADCLGQCVISGWTVVKHLLVVSQESGRMAQERFAVTCEVTGKLLLNDEIAQSALTGKRGANSLFSASPVSSRLGLEEDFGNCEFTENRVLKDELTESRVSGRLFRMDQAATSMVTGIIGHQSEFVTCEVTGNTLLPGESARSDVSGKQVRKELLIKSDKPPGRLGLATEHTRCELTGQNLLSDETAKSAASGKLVDAELLVRSEGSELMSLPEELVSCEVSGKRLLPQEIGTSSLSGRKVHRQLLEASAVDGREGLAEEMRLCDLTGTKVLADELVVSENSGRRFRRDQKEVSEFSGKIGHISEVVTCWASGAKLLAGESAVSAISGKVFLKGYLQPSEKPPGRLGADSEFVICSSTGKRILTDEAARSAVTQNIHDKDILVRSDRSGRRALPTELVVCAETGLKLLPEETAKCAITGNAVDLKCLSRSEVSGAAGIDRLMRRCEVTNRKVLPQELETCALTGKAVAADQMETCLVSGKRGLRAQMIRSAVSGAYLMADIAVKSVASRRPCAPSEAVSCIWSGGVLLPEEVGTCRLTGLIFAKRLLTDGEFVVLRRLLDGTELAEDGSMLATWLQSHAQLSGAKQARIVDSPLKNLRAVCVEIRTMLGLKVRFAGFLMNIEEQQVVGRIVIGRRASLRWSVD